jgi:hypothetical protein
VNDRTVRNLAQLEETASTARVLNLLRVYKRRGSDPAWAARPFFKNPVLNKALILKHRLRRNESELFFDTRRTATKLIIPIDGEDLKLGGRYLFVGQINYDTMLADYLGDSWLADRSDRELLTLIDRLPSLDPFLLREQIRRHGRDPARCYFEISDADMAKMVGFVEREVQKLIDLCYAGSGGATSEQSVSRLVKKILSSTVDAETEPLRVTLRLEKPEYQEGVFSWKGFLYYKWTLREAMPNVTKVADSIRAVKPRGQVDLELIAYLEKSRTLLHAAILSTLEEADKTLRYYDAAFQSLLDGKPQAFRDFLLDAPSMFCELGERLGAVMHIVSFWNYRFPSGRLPIVTGPELVDIISDFEDSLAFAKQSKPDFMLAS